MIVEPSKSVENEGSQKVQVLRERVRSKKRNAEVLLRGVPDESEGGPEEDTRIISTDKKAEKAGGLYLALKGVLVSPTDDIDADKEYELIAVAE